MANREAELRLKIKKKYIGTSGDLTSLDKTMREMYKEDNVYPAKIIIEQITGMYKDSMNALSLAVDESFQESKQQFINSKEFADILEEERFKGQEEGKQQTLKDIKMKREEYFKMDDLDSDEVDTVLLNDILKDLENNWVDKKMKTIKYLCICDYGQVRSVAMAWFIHGLNREDGRIKHLQYEAIPIGSVTTSKKTMKMLKNWADVIIDVRKYIPIDNYGNPNDPQLQARVKDIWEILQLEEKNENKKM